MRWPGIGVRLGAGLAVLAVGGLLLSAASLRARVYTNPVVAQDFPDPSVLPLRGTYWAVSTSSSLGLFPIMSSRDAITWTERAVVFSQPPAWADGSFWAPELVRTGSGVIVYYAARRIGGGMCVAAATAPTPAGPYSDRGPLVCQADGSIDPTSTTDTKGGRFLIWKEDGNSAHLPTIIWAQRTTSDGTRLVGQPRQLLRNLPSSWEGGVIEGPEVVKHAGRLYLFYSGNDCCSPQCRYGVGVARSRSLLGPWQRDPHNPILRQNGTWLCPGHGSVFQDLRGRWLMLYHAFFERRGPPNQRDALLDRVTWGRDGWPQVGSAGTPSSRALLRMRLR